MLDYLTASKNFSLHVEKVINFYFANCWIANTVNIVEFLFTSTSQ